MAEIAHDTLSLNGTRLHVARLTGGDTPVLLLHGWPEFWWTWQPVMERLAAQGFDCIAPDLRGFGDSEPASGPSAEVGADRHARDMAALLDSLGLERVSVVGHDVGAYVAQAMARRRPEHLEKLFFFDCPYPGIGSRWAAPEHLKEIWYQSFHQMPYAAAMVGASRETCRTYIGGIVRHWAAGNPAAFDGDVLDRFVDNFMKPGILQGGFNWYLSSAASRLAIIRGEAPALPPIRVPTCIRWGELDPILPYRWTDRLGETFADLDLAPFRGAGHFPHREATDEAAAEIAAFLRRGR